MIAGGERRRSDRLWMTVPLRAESTDSTGRRVEYVCPATGLNRYGAQIELPRHLEKGQTICLRSPIDHHEAHFRVVGPIGSTTGKKTLAYGVECIDTADNLWGIRFPTPSESEGVDVDVKVLLECGICRTVALVPLTVSEVEPLRTIGTVGVLCQKCGVVTLWRYAEMRVPRNSAGEAAQGPDQGRSRGTSAVLQPIARVHRRVYLQSPLEVRDAKGSLDVIRTENTSKSGLSFTSDRNYSPGEVVWVAFRPDEVTQKTELAARIVRVQAVEGADRKIYGAMFES